MSLSARTPTTFDTAGFIPEVWSNIFIDAAKKELVCFDAVDHSWEKDLAYGDTVNIGVTNHVTATEVVVGTKASALNPISGAKIQLIMDQWYEAPIDIDTMSKRQTQIDPEALARDEGEYSIRVEIDSTVAALFSLLNNSSVQGSDGDEITDDLLIDIMELLDENDVPRDGNRFLILDPSGVADMMKYDKFVSNQYVSQAGAVENGTVMNGHPVYGCAVRVTNNLSSATTGNYCVMLHRKAIAAAVQMELPWSEWYKAEHQIRIQYEALWGVLETRDAYGIPFYSRKA